MGTMRSLAQGQAPSWDAATGAVALADKQIPWRKAVSCGCQAGLSQVLKSDVPLRQDSQVRLSTRRWLGGLVDLLVGARLLQLLRKLPFGCLVCAGIGLVLQQRRHLRRRPGPCDWVL